MIIFGGLIFSALSFYIPIISNPSWPFFIIVYLSTLFIIFSKINLKISSVDLIFILFIGYIFVSFVFFGMSDATTFYYYLILFIILPYLSGKAFGKYLIDKDLNIIIFIAFITLLLIIFEIAINPELINSERLLLWVAEDHDGTGGSPIAININILFGAASIILFHKSIISLKHKRFLNGILSLVFLVFIIFFASRSAIISLFLTFLIMYFLKNKLSLKSSLYFSGLFILLISVFFIIILNLNEDRLNFISAIPEAIDTVSSVFGCNFENDGSIVSRFILWNEAINLFMQNILFGIGSSNFGHFYCGQIEDLASPHMYILHIASELGILGVIFYVMFLILIFKNSVKENNHLNSDINFALLAVWIYLTLISQLNGNYFYDLHLFLISGLLISLSQIRRVKS